MKLYYTVGACSLASHIILEELGSAYEAQLVSFDKGDAEKPEFLKLNPMGMIPLLVTDEGKPISEGAAILQYLADQKPKLNLIPKAGTFERYSAISWLNFISTELHKGFSNLWMGKTLVTDKKAQDELELNSTNNLKNAFRVANEKLAGKEYCLGSHFSVCDAYLFNIANWLGHFDINVSQWPNVAAVCERVKSRPATMKVMKAEGLN